MSRFKTLAPSRGQLWTFVFPLLAQSRTVANGQRCPFIACTIHGSDLLSWMKVLFDGGNLPYLPGRLRSTSPARLGRLGLRRIGALAPMATEIPGKERKRGAGWTATGMTFSAGWRDRANPHHGECCPGCVADHAAQRYGLCTRRVHAWRDAKGLAPPDRSFDPRCAPWGRSCDEALGIDSLKEHLDRSAELRDFRPSHTPAS